MRQWETACETSQRGFRSSQNLEGTEVPAIGHISHDSDSERPTKVASKKRSFFYSLSERPKLRSLLANQNDNGLLAGNPHAREIKYFGQTNLVT